jgi:hypothetical protein
MADSVLVLAAIGALFVVLLVELTAAVLPIVIVILLVPPEERCDLAEVLAAADSRRRLRLWRALRAAVKVRRAALASQSR